MNCIAQVRRDEGAHSRSLPRSQPSVGRGTSISHEDPIAAVALSLATILVTAKLGGDLAVRTGQPAVLGELVGGIVLGNLSLVGISAFTGIKTDPSLEMLARIGALILLFEVGLESTVAEMLDVGMSAMLVAIAGDVAPFALGWGVGRGCSRNTALTSTPSSAPPSAPRVSASPPGS